MIFDIHNVSQMFLKHLPCAKQLVKKNIQKGINLDDDAIFATHKGSGQSRNVAIGDIIDLA